MINVLRAALRVIPKQQITYKKFLGQIPTPIGLLKNAYSEGITVTGSIQPIDADTMYKLGIANTGDVFTCWLHGDVVSVAEIQSNDLIIGADGEVYNVFRSEKWSGYPFQDWNMVFIRRAKNYSTGTNNGNNENSVENGNNGNGHGNGGGQGHKDNGDD